MLCFLDTGWLQMHLLVLLSHGASKMPFALKIQHICLSESRTSLYSFLCVLQQKVSIPSVNEATF